MLYIMCLYIRIQLSCQLYININSILITFVLKVEEHSNRVANYFHSLGYKKGDSIAFFMENRPEYLATWLGLAKIGVTPALINYNLRQQSLIHTIQVSNCKAIIYGIELEAGKHQFNVAVGIVYFLTS